MIPIAITLFERIFPWILWRGDPNDARIHLTFDDGPHPEFTPKILDILGEYDTSAAFFVTGNQARLHPGLVRRIANQGHQIGNHGYTHCSLAFRKKETVLAEIVRTDHTLSQILGKKPDLFRPPYGRFDPRFRSWMAKTGHRMVLWSLLSKDYFESDPSRLVQRATRLIHAGAIVLFHDGHLRTPLTIRILPTFLEAVLGRGFRCSPLPSPWDPCQ